MASHSNQPDEQFSEAYRNWDLERLYTDLASVSVKPLSRNGKRFLKGLLCGYRPAEIAQRCRYQGKNPSDTVRQTLSKEIYPSMKALLNRSEDVEWGQVLRLLEAYRKSPRTQLPNAGMTAHPHQDGEEAANGLAIKLERTASNNPILVEPQVCENLMSLATTILEKLGFNQKFKVSRAFQHVGYRLKNAEKETNPHQLILSQRKYSLCISIRQDILDPHLLNLKYWEYTDVFAEADLFTKARFWVLPSKKDIFLESLHPNYWNSLQAEEKIVGNFELNTCTYFWEEDQGIVSGLPICEAVPSLLLDEFNPDTLSDRDTYLIANYDKLFPGTWQVSISSREVLEEFLSQFAKILMEEQ